MSHDEIDRIRELRIVALDAQKRLEAATAERDAAVEALGRALLDVPADACPVHKAAALTGGKSQDQE